MSAQIDTAIDSLLGANQAKTKAKSNDESSATDVFASLIQGQIPSNIVFSRVDSKLELPQKSAPAGFADPLDTSAKHAADSANSNDHDASSPADRDEDGTSKNDNRAYNDARSEKQNEPAQAAVKDVAPSGAPTQNNTPVVAQAAKPEAASGPATQQTAQASATQGQTTSASKVVSESNGPLNIEGMDAAEAAGAETSALARQSGNGKNNIQATVTNKSEEMSSQPSNTLAASATVAAQTGKEAQNAGDAKLGAGGEKTGTDAEGTVNNAFTKGQNQNGNSNGQQASAQNAGQKSGAEIAQANTDASALQNANFNSALNASANAAPTPPGSTQQVQATVDPMAGISSSASQNTNVQIKIATPPAPHSKPSVPPRVISEQVAVNIQRAIGAGNDRINIQLRPTDLGRIDVSLEMGKDGRMTAVISADKSETLDMLKSDSKGLIQSLNDAGLKTDSDGLSFNLNDNNGDASQFASDSKGKGNAEENEFNLDGEETIEGSTYLADGEKAQFDDDGHIDVNV